VKFFDLFYEIEGLKSGMHHPEGIFWVRDARVPRPTGDEHVPLESIAPTILDLMAIRIPDHLKAASLLQGSAAHTLESV
jgi:predicted AlkP superfamily phosphohydrolase/phosphomutase